jgi:uncharacterized tellurite resistance protein B-like protein
MLPVARIAPVPAAGLPYWPFYERLIPGQRRIYLEWMAGGRRTMPPEIGYAFIFFYGLERRALVDEADHAHIFNEVFRLRMLNSQQAGERFNWSFDSYSSSLLWHLVISFPTKVTEKAIRLLMETTRSWSEDAMSAALAWFVLNNRPLPDWAAQVVAWQLPGCQRSVVVTRVADEFRALFAKRYAERFGQGLMVRSAKRDRAYVHRPGSAALRPFERRGPNPMGLTSQFSELSEVWNACVEDLRRLSSVVKKQGQEEMTPAAWEAMPPEIRAGVEHPMTDAICRLVNESADEQGQTRIQVARLAGALGLESRERLTAAQSRNICETAEYVGFGLEPDARLTGKSYRADERVATFLRTGDDKTEPARYSAASCMLRLGLVAASADGNASVEEMALVTRTIEEMFQLNDEEQRRLESLRSLLLSEGADTTGLASVAKALGSEQRQAVAKLLLLVVARDGVVTKREVRALKKCYSLLGFSKAESEQALATIESYRTDEPVTVQAGAPGAAGEAIPAPPPEGLQLNRAAIEAIMRDTQEVARLLAEAMSAGQDREAAEVSAASAPSATTTAVAEAEPEAPEQAEPIQGVRLVPDALTDPLVVQTSDPTLPQRYAAFYQMLITRDEWSRAELEALARQHGLMLGGAIDALNDWAFEKFGGQLFVDDGARFLVQREYLN